MVNNAGIAQVNPILDVTPEEVDRILRINIEGVLWGIQAAAKKFQARGRKARSSTRHRSRVTRVLPCSVSIRPPNSPSGR